MGMVELSESGRTFLEALIAGPAAWREVGTIADALGLGVDDTMDALCDLDVDGWLEVRDGEDGPLVSLSPLGASRLGVRLVESGVAETPRWARSGDPEPPPPRPRNVCAGERGATLEFVNDPMPRPDLAAELAERTAVAVAKAERPAAAESPARPDALPFPSVLLGVGLTPWPGPGQAPDMSGICPACGGRKLRPHVYCLCCDRWGLDRGSLASDPGEPLAPTPPTRPRPAPDPLIERLQHERFRAHRKARRLKRRQAQTAAGRKNGPGPRPSSGTNSLPNLAPPASTPS
jgi:hypothetical protein